MFSRKFLKGSSVAVVGANLASGLQCQVTSADAYLEAKNEFREKLCLPVNKEQAKEMLRGFCKKRLLNKGDLEEANKILNSEQGFSFVRFLFLLIWLDYAQSVIRTSMAFAENITGFFEGYKKKARESFRDLSGFELSFVAYCYALRDRSFLIRGLKLLLNKGKAFLDSSRSHPVDSYVLILQLKNNNEGFVNCLMYENYLLEKKNGELQSKIDSLEEQVLPNRSELGTFDSSDTH